MNLTFWLQQFQWQELVGVVSTHFTDKPIRVYMRRFAKLLLSLFYFKLHWPKNSKPIMSWPCVCQSCVNFQLHIFYSESSSYEKDMLF